jgi:hypothetical protein
MFVEYHPVVIAADSQNPCLLGKQHRTFEDKFHEDAKSNTTGDHTR